MILASSILGLGPGTLQNRKKKNSSIIPPPNCEKFSHKKRVGLYSDQYGNSKMSKVKRGNFLDINSDIYLLLICYVFMFCPRVDYGSER